MTERNPYAEMLAGRDPDEQRPNDTPYESNDPVPQTDFTQQAHSLAGANALGVQRQFGSDIYDDHIRDVPIGADPRDIYPESYVTKAPNVPDTSVVGRTTSAFKRGFGGTVEALGEGLKSAGEGPYTPALERSEILDTPIRMGTTRYGSAGGAKPVGEALQGAGGSVAEYGKEMRDNAPKASQPELSPILSEMATKPSKAISDLGVWAWEKLIEGAGSTVPYVAGAVVGGPTGLLMTGNTMGVGQVRAELDGERDKLMQEAGQAKAMGLDVAAERLAIAAANLTPDKQRGIINASGAIVGALDSIVPMSVAGAFGGHTVKDLVAQHVVRSLITKVAAGAGEEGATEAVQEAVQIIAMARMKGVETAQDYADELYQNRWRIFEAGAAGAVAGAGFGAVGAAKSHGPETPKDLYADAEPTQTAALPPEQAPQTQTPQAGVSPSETLQGQPEAAPEATAPLSPQDVESAVETWKQAQAQESATAPIEEAATEVADTASPAVSPVVAQAEEIVSQLAPEQQAAAQPIIQAVAEAMPEIADQASQAVPSQEVPAQVRQQLESLGIAQAKTEQEVRQILAERGQAQAQAQAATAKLQSYLASGGGLTGGLDAVARGAGLTNSAQVAESLRSGISQGALKRTMTGRIASVEVAHPKTAEGVQATIADIARKMAPILPRGTTVKSFSDLKGLPANVQVGLEQKGDRVVDTRSGGQVDAFALGDTVYLADYAMRPGGRISHEAVHALKSAGLISDQEIALLAERARKTGAFSKTSEAQYRRAYKDRYPNDLDERIDEEAAAHLIEARVNGEDFGRKINSIIDHVIEFVRRFGNALRGMGFQTTDDVANALLSGEMARRKAVSDWMRSEDLSAVAVRPNAMMAMADRQTGQDMRRSLDDLGYVSHALEAARSLKQVKGTPEQMLAQLKSAGVKDAEIEATGLGEFLKSKGSRPEPGARNPEAGATGASSVLAETPEYKRAEAAAVKAYEDDLRENETRYFDKDIEYDDNGDRIPLDPNNLPSLYSGSAFDIIPATATAVEAGANALGFDLSLWRSVTSASRYGTIEINGQRKKVRVADHARQSGLHDGADYNIAPGGMTPFEFFEALVQAKGTPEQMLAQLKSAGVKQAEIEATGLDKFLAQPQTDPMDDTIASLGDLRRRLTGDGPFFVRWSRGPDYDLKRGAVSKDYQTGRRHAGLSAEEIDVDSLDDGLFRVLRDYGYLRASNNPAKPHIYAGKVVGEDSDGAPSIVPTRYIGTLSDDFIARLDDDTYYERLLLTTSVARDKIILSHRQDDGPPAFYAGVEKELADAEKRLSELGGTPSDVNDTASKPKPRSITRDEIISHLEGNRVGMREVNYGYKDDGWVVDPYQWGHPQGEPRHFAGQAEAEAYAQSIGLTAEHATPLHSKGKWQAYSLDPSNPTYRETVLHLPSNRDRIVPERQPLMDEFKALQDKNEARTPAETDRMEALRTQLHEFTRKMNAATDSNFTSGHFPEPNIVGHMMTSMTKHEGKPVYTIDQIQSDWGQKLRDGGVRDEAKIAELERLYREANAKALAMEADRLPTLTTTDAEAMTKQKFGDAATWATLSDEQRQEVAKLSAENTVKNTELNRRMDAAGAESDRLEAEWNTARNSAVGHPLVNTTDQWTVTTLRRALRQAAEADAAYIAIPTGDTVLSYNPEGQSGPNGMRGFYGTSSKEGIVPKNLRKLLEKIDKDAKPVRVEKLETPSKGLTNRGDLKISDGGSDFGFTLFPLSDKVKAEVRDAGQPMFAFGGERAKTADLEALSRAKEMDSEGTDRAKIWKDTGWFKGVDGKWRFEIDDSQAKIDLSPTGIKDLEAAYYADHWYERIPFVGAALEQRLVTETGPLPADQLVQHNDLFAAYPDARNTPVSARIGDGSYYESSGRIGVGVPATRRDPLPKYLHEAMHDVQNREGFARGGDLSMYYRDLIAAGKAPDEAAAAAQNWGAAFYNRLAGEVESRAVEKRAGLTQEERRARPPWLDYDIPESQQIVRFADGSGVSQLSYSAEPPVKGFPTIKGNVMFALRGEPSAAPEVKSLQSIVGDLARDLGLVMRQGLTKTAAGKAAARAGLSSVYDPQTGVLRVTSVSDIQAVAAATAPVLRHRFGTRLDMLIGAHARELADPVDSMRSTTLTGMQIDLRDMVTSHIESQRLAAAQRTASGSKDPNAVAMAQRARDDAQLAFQKVASIVGPDQAVALRTEVIHQFDLPAQIGIDPVSAAEVSRIVGDAYDERLQPKEKPVTDPAAAEPGWSDFMRQYVMNPTNAVAKYPRFTRAFENFLNQNDPILLAKLESAQEAIDLYYKADPTRFVDAIVHDPVKGTRWERFKADRDQWGTRGALSIRMNSFYTASIDQQNPMFTAVWELLNEIKRTTGKTTDLAAALNPYKLLRLAPHTHAWATRDMENGVRDYATNEHTGPGMIPALVTALGKDRREARDTGPGSIYRSFSSYLVARYSAIEWQRHLDGSKERPPTVMPPRSGSPAQAIAYFREAQAQLEARYPAFAQAADQIYDYQQNLLKLQRDAGLIKPEVYDLLIKDREYVPFYREFDEHENVPNRALGTGAGGVLKRKRGSDRNVIDPIASIAQKTFETRSIIAINDVKRNLLRLSEAAGPGGGVIAERLDRSKLAATGIDVDKIINAAADDFDLDASDIPAQMTIAHQVLGNDAVATYYTQKTIPSPGRPAVVFFFENGEVQAMQLGNGGHGHKLAAQMLDNLNTFGKIHNEAMNALVAIGRAPAQLIRIGITTHPEFAAANIVRDALMAFQYDKRAIPFWTQIKGAIDVARGADYVQQYYANAGMMGGEATAALDKLRMDRDIRALVERGYKFKLVDSLPNMIDRLSELFEVRNWKDRAVGAAVGAISGAAAGGPIGAGFGAIAGGLVGGSAVVKVGEASETATRAQLYQIAYKRALDNGLDAPSAAQEAAFWAHDYTDYSRRGSKIEGFAAIVPFLNANLQGNDVYLRRLLGKGDQSYTPGVMQGLLYPAYRLGLFDVSKLSAKEQQQLGESAWTWAMTIYGLGSITAVIALLWQDDDRIKDIDDRVKASHWLIPVGDEIYRIPKPFQTVWLSQMIERYITEAGQDNSRWFEHYVEDLWNTWKPPIVPSIAEVGATALGYDLNSGRQIIPDYVKRANPARVKQFDAYTSEFAKWAGPQLDTSPMLVDHMITKFGATWGRTALGLNVPGTPWYNENKPVKGPEEEFISRRFMWKVGRGSEAGQALRQIMGAEEPLKLLWGRLAQPYSNLKVSADNYKDLIEKPIPDHAGAVAMLETMTPYERGYALLEGTLRGPNEAKYRLLHPMNRASKMATEMLKMEKEVVGGEMLTGRKGKDLKEVPMSPTEKTAVRDMLTQLRMMETHNALVLTEEPGWKGRMLFKPGDVMNELKVAAPKAHKELLSRFTKAGILPWDGIAKVWPDLKTRLEDPRMMERARRNRLVGAGAQFSGLYEKARAARPGSYQPAEESAPAN